jgi:hypothetical protein
VNFGISLSLGYQKNIFLMIFLTGIVISFLPNASGYFIPKSHLELYLEHDLIVFGKVLSSHDVVADSNQTPSTQYKIEILQPIKGKIQTGEITVVGLGSINSTRQLEDQTILSKGNQGIFMLTQDKDGNWFISPYSVFSDSLNPDKQFILPPLKLYKAGISTDEIKCKSNLELALKSSNDNPVCLVPESKEKLSERGWIK